MIHAGSGNASWQELLAAPPDAAHVLHVHDDDAFLARAVAHFAAEGLKRGEAVFLGGTPAHLDAIRRRLAAHGVDVAGAEQRRQLSIEDAQETIRAVVAGEGRDEQQLAAALGEAFDRHRGPFAGLRWWGEHSSLLYAAGRREEALFAEQQGNRLAREHDVKILCSLQCDRFDPSAYDGALREMSLMHTHLVPAEDYVTHRMAVNRAIAEVVGEIRGSLLQSLSTWKGPGCNAPSSQALLFWLRETMPEHFGAVLARARAYRPGGVAEGSA